MLTSDHGEGLGDHGEATHGVFAYESTLRVPLVLHNPRLFAPRVVTASARHVDLVPTILDALGLAVPEGLPGRSLVGIAAGIEAGEAPSSYFETLTPALTRGWAPIHGVLRDRLKYLDPPLPELYDLAADPREEKNLVAAAARSARGDAGPPRPPAGRGHRARPARPCRPRCGSGSRAWATWARAAGWRPTTARATIPSGTWPSRTTWRRSSNGTSRATWPESLSLCEQLVRDNPHVPLGLRHLSFLRHRAGDLAGAVRAGREALAADPGSVETAVELGRLLDEIGQPREAAAVLAPYAKAEGADLDVLMTYGMALARTGQKDPSIAILQRARQADPSSAAAAFSLGTAYLLFADHGRAREAFLAAVALEPDMARAYDSLGLLAAVDGKPDEAARLWARALELAPDDADTLFNLGTLLWRQGRREEARPYLERFLAVAPPARYAEDLARVRTQLGTPKARSGPARD